MKTIFVKAQLLFTIILITSYTSFSQNKELELMFREFDEGCKIINENISKSDFETYFEKASGKLSSSKLRFSKVQGVVSKSDRDSIIVSFNRVEEVIRNKRPLKLYPETKMKASFAVAFERADMKEIAKKYNVIIQDKPKNEELSKEDEELSKRMIAQYNEHLRKDSINKVRRDSIERERERLRVEEEERTRKVQKAALQKKKEDERKFRIINHGVTGIVKDVGKFEKNGEKVKGIEVEFVNHTDKTITKISGKMTGTNGPDEFGFLIEETIVIPPQGKVRVVIPHEVWYKEYTNQKLIANVNFSKELFISSHQKQFKASEIQFQDGEVIKTL